MDEKFKIDGDIYNKLNTEQLGCELEDILNDVLVNGLRGIESITWTYDMKRLYNLTNECLKYDEPVCGKTTVVQMLSLLKGQSLRIINCHQHTETSDILGGLRPVRGNKKLKWN